MDKNNNQLDLIIVNQLVAEALGVAYASYAAKCKSWNKVPVAAEDFFEIYKGSIGTFRQRIGAADPYSG